MLAMVSLFSCTPEIELREQPANYPGLEFTIDDTDPNQPILTISDESVFNANWYFDDGAKLQGKSVQCFYPLKGDYPFTIIAMNGKGQTTGTGSVNIPVSNPDLVYSIPEYVALCGEKGDNGKFWVWYQDEPGGDVSYMTANYDWEEFWWNPYTVDEETAEDLPGILNEIKFDLEGGFNFTRYEVAGGNEEKGSFQFDPKNMTLTINNAHIPNYDDPNIDPAVVATGQYKIQVINDYELLLWQDVSALNPNDYDYGWAWKFKARDLVPTDDPVYKLCFDAEGNQKSWVFDQSGAYGACYMTANYDWEEAWWNPYAGAVESLPDYNNTIQFEKNGTYTRFDGAGGQIEQGTYKYDRAESKITFEGATLPNYDEENLDPDVAATNIYEVKIVEQDQLFLWQDGSELHPEDYDYGWAWIFKPVE